MNEYTQEPRDYRFVIGLLTGAFAGAGLALIVPRLTSDLRQRMTDSAKSLGQRASNEYQQVRTRVDAAVDDLTRKGQDVRDDVAGVVARGAHEVARGAHEVAHGAHQVERGAHEVERYAMAAKSDHADEVRTHAAADRSASKRVAL
jgi:gas vesicle protein